MTDLHDDYERAYLRRVRDPNPLMQDLASQAIDSLDGVGASDHFRLRRAADQFGVPLAYLLDEVERRVRERQA